MAQSTYFYRLEPVRCLQAAYRSGWVRGEAFGLVTASGRMESGKFNDLGFLQLCLYHTVLFQFEGAFAQENSQIRDLRTDLRRAACQNRSQLVEVLADLMMQYDSNCAHLHVAEPYLRKAEMQRALNQIRSTLTAFLALRSQNNVPENPALRHLHQTAVNAAYDTIDGILRALTIADYSAICHYEFQFFHENLLLVNHDTKDIFFAHTLDNDLLVRMCTAFHDYGPSHNYPRQAVLHAMAAILIAFGLEEGERPQVAQRLQRRLHRYAQRRKS